ncbi:hypothetical protein [Microbulbifer sp. GL-2]|uniref:hypothetical protein n=1 Tax=Microbulbifer sp. GL-2 TaxID=2591606 RepID=UPI00117C3F5A|nr:hypothetical protein [Microbulbifer sp. GL-2]
MDFENLFCSQACEKLISGENLINESVGVVLLVEKMRPVLVGCRGLPVEFCVMSSCLLSGLRSISAGLK